MRSNFLKPKRVTANAEIYATSCVYFQKTLIMRNELRLAACWLQA